MSRCAVRVVWLFQKELRSRQASTTDGCRSQREGQMAEYRAINECWSLSRKEQKRLAASNALSIQSRVERERSTKRLTGDCPDDHFLYSRYPPVPCFPTLLPRQVSRYIQILLAVSAAVTGSLLSAYSLQRSRATSRHSSNLPYLALPTFTNFRVSPQPSGPVRFPPLFQRTSYFICPPALSQTVASLSTLCRTKLVHSPL
jgi:hypothetical protein